jgi:hypothetical protein
MAARQLVAIVEKASFVDGEDPDGSTLTSVKHEDVNSLLSTTDTNPLYVPRDGFPKLTFKFLIISRNVTDRKHSRENK